MAVEPSLIASREYSTWNRRPSGEKVLGYGKLQGEQADMMVVMGAVVVVAVVVEGGGEYGLDATIWKTNISRRFDLLSSAGAAHHIRFVL